MSISSSAALSKTSIASSKSRRSGKSLAEKIRELGYNLKSDKTPITWDTLHFVDIKIEDNRASYISVMLPNLNLKQIVFYQPEITSSDFAFGRHIYKIDKFETKSEGPKEITRISDIEVKSFKPLKQMKFRKKKRHSFIISKIEEILNRGKGPMLSRDPSEESVILDHETYDQPKKMISDLPESILQKIFFYLNQKERGLVLSRVCKSWYYMLKDPIFWTELEFIEDHVPIATIIHLIKRYSSLKKLRLTSVPNAVEILQELCRCNHSIKNLGVRHCNIGNQDFARIILHVISCCTNLEVLDIKGMRFQSESFYLELGRLKKLRSLNFTGNKYLRSQDLITLAINCRELQELKILDTITDNEEEAALTDDDLTFIISHLEQNLQILKIDMQQLRNVSYQAILKCSRLKYLALKNCLLLTSDTFRQFPSLTCLKKLKLTRAINIKPEDFHWVFSDETMHKIEHLDINGCCSIGDTGFQTITHKLKSLKSLSLKNCKSIKGCNLAYLSRCSELIDLNLAHTEIEARDLLCLSQHVNHLRNLVIDPTMYKKSTIKQLRKFYPSLTIKLSYSEFQKDERLLNDF